METAPLTGRNWNSRPRYAKGTHSLALTTLRVCSRSRICAALLNFDCRIATCNMRNTFVDEKRAVGYGSGSETAMQYEFPSASLSSCLTAGYGGDDRRLHSRKHPLNKTWNVSKGRSRVQSCPPHPSIMARSKLQSQHPAAKNRKNLIPLHSQSTRPSCNFTVV